MSTAERLLQEAKMLPPVEQLWLSEMIAQEARASEIEARRAAVEQAFGSMAGILPSVDEFLAEKHAELEQELKRQTP